MQPRNSISACKMRTLSFNATCDCTKKRTWRVQTKRGRYTTLWLKQRKENERRVRDTNQFKQMKKLMCRMQAQNIKDLRRRLQQYEPDDDADEKEEI